MATEMKLPAIPLEIPPSVPPEKAVAFLGDVFFTRAEAVLYLKDNEKRFQAKAKAAENVDGLRGATDQAEACANVRLTVARYNPEKAGGLLDLATEFEKEREELRRAREGD